MQQRKESSNCAGLVFLWSVWDMARGDASLLDMSSIGGLAPITYRPAPPLLRKMAPSYIFSQQVRSSISASLRIAKDSAYTFCFALQRIAQLLLCHLARSLHHTVGSPGLCGLHVVAARRQKHRCGWGTITVANECLVIGLGALGRKHQHFPPLSSRTSSCAPETSVQPEFVSLLLSRGRVQRVATNMLAGGMVGYPGIHADELRVDVYTVSEVGDEKEGVPEAGWPCHA